MTAWFLENRVTRPNTVCLDALTTKAERRLEHLLHKKISARLSAQHKRYLDGLLVTGQAASPFAMLDRSPNGASVKAVQDVVARLDVVRGIGLNQGIINDIHPNHVATFARRAASEDA